LTGSRQELHELVRAAGLAAMQRCTSGTEFREVHRTAARVVAEGLVGFGLLRGDPDVLVERETVSLFFPHGVGHMLGLGIRDAGGSIGRPLRDEFPRLRADLPLRSGHVVTIEPGIYLPGEGGVRIEDLAIVREDGVELLTSFPKDLITVG
jgi:Xaa-Pro aminopeptidase